MTTGLDADVVGTEEAAERRDEVVAAVTEHAGRMARGLARLKGGDYGQQSVDTDAGTWTLKYEGGDIEYLRFEHRGDDIYVVSTKQPPDPAELAEAMADYDAFVAAYEEYVHSLEGVLDDVSTDFPGVASVDDAVAERERVLSQMREVTNMMAQQLYRFDGDDYGSFSVRVNGSRWELKWEEGRTSYLRVGGEGGIYVLSQYQPPSAHDLRANVDDFPAFVEAFNEHVSEVSDSLSTVSL